MSATVSTYYTYSKTGANWNFVSNDKKHPDFELKHPVLLSKLLADMSGSNNRTFAYRNMNEDLVVDCAVDRQTAISLAARRIVVLETGSLAAPFLRIESGNPVFCVGALKFNEQGSNAVWIGPYRVEIYSGNRSGSGYDFTRSQEWHQAINHAHCYAGVPLDLAGAEREQEAQHDRAVQAYYARTS